MTMFLPNCQQPQPRRLPPSTAMIEEAGAVPMGDNGGERARS